MRRDSGFHQIEHAALSSMSTPVTELTVESASMLLWNEFLTAFFDGGAHDVGQNLAVQFPQATVVFGQAPPGGVGPGQSQELEGAEIRVICEPGPVSAMKNSRRFWSDDSPINAASGVNQDVWEDVNYLFMVRAHLNEPVANENSVSLCQKTADLLFGVLQNSTVTQTLAENGLTRIRPTRPRLIGDAYYSARLVSAHCRVQYQVKL